MTGTESTGGDWELESAVGLIQAPLVVSRAAGQRYRSTLDVTVNAQGAEGGEAFQLLVDNQIVQSWTATTDLQSYRRKP